MTTFVDTSALYALMDGLDDDHARAAGWLSGDGADPGEILMTHNYVVVETAALAQRRLGTDAARELFDAYVSNLSVLCIEEELHTRAVSAYLATDRRRFSFVDIVSFAVMRDRGVHRAFCFDRDFAREGFDTVP